jgi:uncharacterized protein YegJ (DUF2314 family)
MSLRRWKGSILFLLLVGAGCTPLREPPPRTPQAGDPEMEAAIQQARRQLPEFVRVLQKPTPQQAHFVIRAIFREGDKTETMWVNQVRYRPGVFSGTLDNKPYVLQNLKRGDKVEVRESDVRDWAYREGDKMIGGFTIQLMDKRMKSPRSRLIR